MATCIEFSDNGPVATITFRESEPNVPCTLSHDVLDRLDEIIDRVEKAGFRYRALVVRSASPKYFVVGADLQAVQALTPDTITAWVEKGHRIFNRLENLPLPVLARVEGYALGGGLELAMACDIIVAGERARFGQPEATLGLMPGWGATFRLPLRVGVTKAKELFVTGKKITAREALEIGLINAVAAPEELDAAVDDYLRAICANDAQAIGYIKQIVNQTFGGGIGRNCRDEAVTSRLCLHSPSTAQRLNDFFASRK